MYKKQEIKKQRSLRKNDLNILFTYNYYNIFQINYSYNPLNEFLFKMFLILAK